MTFERSHILSILKAWFTPSELSCVKIAPITAGLSGAKLWRVTLAEHEFCLRRWPVEISDRAKHLQKIHALIEHCWTSGFQRIPLVRRSLDHKTLIEADNRWWELEVWLSGKVINNPTEVQAKTAVNALAEFHKAAATFAKQKVTLAPGLQKRLAILDDQRQLTELELAIRCAPASAQREIAVAMFADLDHILPSALALLRDRAAKPLPLQWCLRDVHHGNFLFTENQVTGLIDFGTAAVDSVAGDLARLIASLVDDDRLTWATLIEAYDELRPISSDECQAIGAYHLGGVMAAAANWIRWVFIEGHPFANEPSSQARMAKIAKQLGDLSRNRATFSTLSNAPS